MALKCQQLAFSMFAASSFFAGPAHGSDFETFPHSQARLISEADRAAPGNSITIALHIKLDPDWYSYWQNPADAGASPLFFFELPPGVEVSEPFYPLPQRLESDPLVAFGYTGETMYMFELRLAQELEVGESLDIALSAEWLVCKVECIPAFGDFPLAIQIASNKEYSPNAQDISRFQSKIPVAIEPEALGLTVSKSQDQQSLLMSIDTTKLYSDVDFFPDNHVALSYAKPKILETTYNNISLTLQRTTVQSDIDQERVAGVLLLKDSAGINEAYYIETTLSQTRLGPEVNRAYMLLLAFIGGLLLNLMPCVFPVISIKLFGIVKHAHGRPGLVQLQCLSYVAGVVLSFLAVGGLLVALRMSGQAFGWGFQLQSPIFLAFLVLLFAFLGFYFLGEFKISFSVGSLGSKLMRKDGVSGQFFTGILSTVVASPCTAPFMGVAMGAAITQSTPFILLTFATLGLGLAAPYFIFVVYPKALSWLPKPGAWMETLQQFLAFPLLATCIWLIWVLTQVAGSFVMAATLLGVLCLAAAIWVHTRLQRPIAAIVIALMAIGLNLGYAARDHSSNLDTSAMPQSGIDWKVFDPAQIEQSIADGFIVFVDFTADWCITCKVNERLTFTDKRVSEFISKHEIVMYKADWTRRDRVITETLDQYGRIGVPMYLLRLPGKSKGFVLPEILTPAVFINEISRHADLSDT